MNQGRPRIQSFKLNEKKGKKRGVLVQFKRTDVTDKGTTINVDTPGQFFELIPHPDLVNLFKQLSPHYALITEREDHDDSTIARPDEVERCAARFPCGSIQFKEGENWSGVQWHGAFVLSTGHHCNSLTRLVKFNQPNPDYPLADELQELCEKIEAEIHLCIDGKVGEPPPKGDPAQTSITDLVEQPPVAVGHGNGIEEGEEDDDNG